MSKNQKKKLHHSKVAKGSLQADTNEESKTGGPLESSREKKSGETAER